MQKERYNFLQVLVVLGGKLGVPQERKFIKECTGLERLIKSQRGWMDGMVRLWCDREKIIQTRSQSALRQSVFHREGGGMELGSWGAGIEGAKRLE